VQCLSVASVAGLLFNQLTALCLLLFVSMQYLCHFLSHLITHHLFAIFTHRLLQYFGCTLHSLTALSSFLSISMQCICCSHFQSWQQSAMHILLVRSKYTKWSLEVYFFWWYLVHSNFFISWDQHERTTLTSLWIIVHILCKMCLWRNTTTLENHYDLLKFIFHCTK